MNSVAVTNISEITEVFTFMVFNCDHWPNWQIYDYNVTYVYILYTMQFYFTLLNSNHCTFMLTTTMYYKEDRKRQGFQGVSGNI